MDKFKFSPTLRVAKEVIKLFYVIYKISITAFSFIFILMIVVQTIKNHIITWDQWTLFMVCIVLVIDVFIKIDWKDGND